jgi:hypothetical protein
MPPLARHFANLIFQGLVYEEMATGLTAPPLFPGPLEIRLALRRPRR